MSKPTQTAATHASKANSTKPASRAHPNQSHLGLKACIISTSVLGTVAGWAVLVDGQSAPMASADPVNAPSNSVKASASSFIDTLGWALPDVVARNNPSARVIKERRINVDSNVNVPLPKTSETAHTQSNVREVPVLPAPAARQPNPQYQPPRPRPVQPVARSQSSR